MQHKLTQFIDILRQDPAVANVTGFTGGGQTNSGLCLRRAEAAWPSARCRRRRSSRGCGQSWRRWRARGFSCRRCRTSGSAGARTTRAVPVHAAVRRHRRALRVGARSHGRAGAAAATDRRQFRPAAERARNRAGDRPRHRRAARRDRPADRQHAVRRVRRSGQVSTIYAPRNQYHVVMEVAPRILADPRDAEQDLCQHRGGAVSGTQATQRDGGHRARQGRRPTNSSARRRPTTQIAGKAARNAGDERDRQ